MTYSVDETQRRAARVVGFAYLFVLVPALFAEFYASGQLIDYNDAAETARNIVAYERLFRLGIASNLIVFATGVRPSLLTQADGAGDRALTGAA